MQNMAEIGKLVSGSVIPAATQAYVGYQSGRSQGAASDYDAAVSQYQAGVAGRNANLVDLDIGMSKRRTKAQLKEHKRGFAQQAGAKKAVKASFGQQVGGGSALDIARAEMRQAQEVAAAIGYQGDLERFNLENEKARYRGEQSQYKMQSKQYEEQGKVHRRSGILGALKGVPTLMTGISKFHWTNRKGPGTEKDNYWDTVTVTPPNTLYG